MFHHVTHSQSVVPKYRFHGLVWLEVHLVLRILQPLILDVGIQFLYHLTPGQFLPLLGPNYLSKSWRDLKGGVDSLSLNCRHFVRMLFQRSLN